MANRVDQRNQETFSGDARMKLKIIEPLSISAFGSYLEIIGTIVNIGRSKIGTNAKILSIRVWAMREKK
jgi:hypothetical protein